MFSAWATLRRLPTRPSPEHRQCRPSTVPRSPRSRLYPPCAALSAVPAQERLGRRVRLHEAVERRWRETVTLAAGQIAGRHERRRLGGGNARDQENYGDAAQPAHGRFRLRRVTLSPASRMGQLSSSVGSRSAFVALAATRLPVPIQVPRRIFSSAALAMKAERVSPCAAAGGFASARFDLILLVC